MKVVKQKTPHIVDGIPFTFFAFQHIQSPLLAPGGGTAGGSSLAAPLASAKGLLTSSCHIVVQPEPPGVPLSAGGKLRAWHTENSTLEFLMNDQLNVDVL